MARPFSDEFLLEEAKTRLALTGTVPPDILELTEELLGEREWRTDVDAKNADLEEELRDCQSRLDKVSEDFDKLCEKVMGAVRRLKDISPGYDTRAAQVAYDLSVAVTEAKV